MPVISGKDGTLYLNTNEVAPVANWRLKKTSSNKHYTANDTGGCRKRVAGARDCSGRFEIKATETGNTPVDEGETVTLKLHVDESNNNYYEVPAIIDTIRTDVDISEGKIVAYVVDFSGNGPVVAHGVLSKTGGSTSSGS